MTSFLTLLLAVLGLMAPVYLVLALALRARERRHGRCGCSGAPGERGTCCRDAAPKL